MPLVIALVCLAGAGLLLYPAAAAWFSAVAQSERLGELSDAMTDQGAATLRSEFERALAYNAGLTGVVAAVEAHERLPRALNTDDPETYRSLLRADADGLMARVKIPAIDVDLPIYHGTSEAVLEVGVGHLEGTALPVGGSGTHAVLTGHRGLATAELFDDLDRVGVDDRFTVETFGEVLVYRVTRTQVVEPEDTESLIAVSGQDLLTLVTCTPLGVNSHRILVTGERIIPTPQPDLDAAGEPALHPGLPWWALIGGGVLLVAGVYVHRSGLPARRRR